MTYDHDLMIRYTFYGIVIKANTGLNYVITVKNEGWSNNVPF